MKQVNYTKLLRKLRLESTRICYMNHCTQYKHKCNTTAFINSEGRILNICIPVYFKGSLHPVAKITLPFLGNKKELKQEILNQISKEKGQKL